jgi:hypothetical protein
LFEEFCDRLTIFEARFPLVNALEVELEVVEPLQGFLGGFRLVPKVGLRGYLLEVANFGGESREVKDSPGFSPGDRRRFEFRV